MRLARVVLPVAATWFASSGCSAPETGRAARVEATGAPSGSYALEEPRRPSPPRPTSSEGPSGPPTSTVTGVEIPAVPEGGCEVRATKWDGTISLRPGLAFARVVDVPATLTLHEPPSAHVTVDASIRLHALVERPVIHAARPTTLSAFAIPFPDTGLDWARVDRAGKITVEIATADLFADPPKATLEVDCGDLTATEPTYDLPGVLRGLPGVEVSLAGGAAIAATPLGAIVATLGSEGAPAVVIESKGASRRVVVRAYGYWAVGWVDAKFVGNDAFVRGESGRGFLDGYGEYAGTPPSCDHELPVFGQIANERAHLGTLRAGTGYRRTAPQPDGLEPGWTSIALVSPWLRPLEGAWLLVRNEDLTNCP